MIYEGAIDCVIGRPPPGPGDPVLVSSNDREIFAWGVFNPNSLYRVRVMQTKGEVERDGGALLLQPEAVLRARIRAAAELRQQLCLPSSDTTVYRLVNSEGDRLSGLVVDILGDSAVCASSAAWVERHRAVVEEEVRAASGCSELIWRPSLDMLKEEGVAPAHHEEQEQEEQREVVVQEAGVSYWANPRGQKTGFYADQRDSRVFIRDLARGKRVLDLCCYSGGFALNAAIGGAAEVLGVDSSQEAVQLAARNAELNGVEHRARFVRSDIESFMKVCLGTWQRDSLSALGAA